jgi:hypothetical protein
MTQVEGQIPDHLEAAGRRLQGAAMQAIELHAKREEKKSMENATHYEMRKEAGNGGMEPNVIFVICHYKSTSSGTSQIIDHLPAREGK